MPEYSFLFLIFTSITSACFAQTTDFSIRNFSQSDYQSGAYTAGPQNFDIASDNRGVVYVANSTTLLEFDGISWRAIKNADSLKESAHSLAKNSKGRIFTGGKNDLGFLAPDSSGLMCFNSLKDLLLQKNFLISKTLCLRDSIYFIADSSVFQYSNGRVQIVRCDNKIVWAGCLNNMIYILVSHRGLFQLRGAHLEFAEGTGVLGDLVPVEILSPDFSPPQAGRWMVVTSNGIFKWNGNLLIRLTGNSLLLSNINCAKMLDAHTLAIGTNNEGLVITTDSGKILNQINKQSGLIDNLIMCIYTDSTDGLWVGLSSGISRIDFPTAISHFNDENGINGIILCTQRYHDELFVGTFTGLYSSQLTSPAPAFKVVPEFSGVWSMTRVNDDFFISANEGIFCRHNGQQYQITGNVANCFYHSDKFPDYMFAGFADGIGIIQKRKGGWKYVGQVRGLTAEVKRMAMDSLGMLFAGKREFYKVDFSQGVSLDSKVLPVSIHDEFRKGELFYLFQFNNQIFAGSAYEGFWKYDSRKNYFIRDTILNTALGKKCEIAVPYVDEENRLWFVDEGRVGNIIKKNQGYGWDSAAWVKLPKTSIWDFFRDQQFIWIGTPDGLYRYDLSVIKNYSHHYPALIRTVKVNDIPVFHGAFFSSDGVTSTIQNDFFKKRIPYKSNSISFDYAAATYDSREKTLFSYSLDGQDKTWSAWSLETKKEYTGLWEGDYIFHVRAKNIYGAISNESTFEFTILPPWYRAWWAWLLYALAAAVIIRGIIQWNQWRLIKDKKLLTKKVEERTKEISRQKELVETEKENVERKTRELETTLDALRQTQSQLIQSEKMASIGLLTAGIAHEINNPINFVSGNVNPLKRNFDDVKKLIGFYEHLLEQSNQKQAAEERRKEFNLEENFSESAHLLEGIEEGSRRTAMIVKGLRNFSRLDTEDMKLVNINEGLESTLTLIQNKLNEKNIELIKSLGDIPGIEGYPGQLNQVFMNLLTNAIDAVNSNGKIFIRTWKEKNYVAISIRDTGNGMSEEVRQKIFDPFFTTKEVGKGTGLGLSISYGIIEKHKGKIEVKTEPGNGTEFIILLPA